MDIEARSNLKLMAFVLALLSSTLVAMSEELRLVPAVEVLNSRHPPTDPGEISPSSVTIRPGDLTNLMTLSGVLVLFCSLYEVTIA